MLREIAAQRCHDSSALLLPSERKALEAALELDDPTLRACACMDAAARLDNPAQVQFWRQLPATLAQHVNRIADQATSSSGASPMRAQGLKRRAAALGKGPALYATEGIVREAAQRLDWHESAHGGSFGTGEFEATEESGEVCCNFVVHPY